MSAELASVRKELDQVRKERLLDQARVEGKVIPLSAEGIAAAPLATIEELVKNAKAGAVPLKGAANPPGVEGQKADAFSAEEREVFAKFGLTPEAVKKATEPAA